MNQPLPRGCKTQGHYQPLQKVVNMEKQVVYEISETTQLVIHGLTRQIHDLEQIISNLETDVVALMNLRENDFVQANQTIENLQNKLEATTAMLIKYYDKADQHWFDQTVSI